MSGGNTVVDISMEDAQAEVGATASNFGLLAKASPKLSQDRATIATKRKEGDEKSASDPWCLSSVVGNLPQVSLDLHKEILLGLFLHCSDQELASLAQRAGSSLSSLPSSLDLVRRHDPSSLTLIPEIMRTFPNSQHASDANQRLIDTPNFWRRRGYASYDLLELESFVSSNFDVFRATAKIDRKLDKKNTIAVFSPISILYNECSLVAWSRWAANGDDCKAKAIQHFVHESDLNDTSQMYYPVPSPIFRVCSNCNKFGHYEIECEQISETDLLLHLAPIVTKERTLEIFREEERKKKKTWPGNQVEQGEDPHTAWCPIANLKPGEPFFTRPPSVLESPSEVDAASQKSSTDHHKASPSKRRRLSSPNKDQHIKSSACTVCHSFYREEDVLLCDGCDAPYHFQCLDPPLEGVPVGEWFCKACVNYDSDVSSVADLEPCEGFLIEQRKQSEAKNGLGNTALGFHDDGWSCVVSVSARDPGESIPVPSQSTDEKEDTVVEQYEIADGTTRRPGYWNNAEADDLDSIVILAKPIEAYRGESIGTPRLLSCNVRTNDALVGRSEPTGGRVDADVDFEVITKHHIRPEKLIGALVTWNSASNDAYALTQDATTSESKVASGAENVMPTEKMLIGSVITLDHFNNFALVRLLPNAAEITSSLSKSLTRNASQSHSLATCRTAIGSCCLGASVWVPVKALSLIQRVPEAGAKEKSASGLLNALKAELRKRKHIVSFRTSDIFRQNDDAGPRTHEMGRPESETGVFQAERILDERFRKGTSVKEYLIKWKGYGLEDCTWEPEKNILSANLVRIFHVERIIKELGETPEAHDCSSVTSRVIDALVEGRNRLRLASDSCSDWTKPAGRICPFCENWFRSGTGLSGHLKKHENEPNYKPIREAFKLGFEYNYDSPFQPAVGSSSG